MRAPDPSARLEGILASVSMLMSRHLRGTVERSLECFVRLFERERMLYVLCSAKCFGIIT